MQGKIFTECLHLQNILYMYYINSIILLLYDVIDFILQYAECIAKKENLNFLVSCK